MIHIKGAPRSKSLLDGKGLRQAAKLTLLYTGIDSRSDMTILVADDRKLHALNLQYLGIDRPTDVLSFPSGDTDPQTGKTYLGDVIISQEQAAAQAEKGGHPLTSEMQLLTVHGILHLLGYDHGTPGEKKKMWHIQGEILRELGLAGIFIQESGAH